MISSTESKTLGEGLAGVLLELAGEELDDSGLAGAVGAHHGHARGQRRLPRITSLSEIKSLIMKHCFL